MTSDAAQSPAKRRLSLILAGGVAGVAVGLAGVYGISLLLGKSAVDPACRPTVETARADRAVRPRRGRRHDRGDAGRSGCRT